MIFSKKSKGFLFTISIIIFASTLVFFSQNYSARDVNKELIILSNYSVLSQPLINNNISNNLKKMLGFDFDIEFLDNNIIIYFDDSFPKNSNFSDIIEDYEFFLKENFFKKTHGSKEIDFSNLKDGSVEIVFGELFVYDIRYNTNDSIFYSDANPFFIDLNFFVNDDLNYYEWDYSEGGVLLNFYYFDNSNQFVLKENISFDNESTLNLVFEDYNNIIKFGDKKIIDINNNSFNKINFDMAFKTNFNSNSFSVWFKDIFLDYYSRNISSKSLLKLFN